MARFTVDNPATGETVTRAEPLSEDRINRLMARASAAARDWAGTGLAERIELCDGFLGRFQAVKGKCWATLCLHGNQLLVRSVDQIACYQLSVQATRQMCYYHPCW